MKNKILWVVVSCLMVLSLLIVSCEEETEKTTTVDEGDDKVKITETETGGTVKEEVEEVETSSDIPQYGGTHNIALAWDVSNWANGLEFC